MTNLSSTAQKLLVILLFVAMLGIAFGVHADTIRDRGTTGRSVDLTPTPIPTPTPQQTPSTPTPPPQSTGGITSTTVGEVDTGNNTGGHVTTGDQSVEVHEVNIGPTNSNSNQNANSGGQVDPPPAPEPEPTPTCDPRNRVGCAASGSGRTR